MMIRPLVLLAGCAVLAAGCGESASHDEASKPESVSRLRLDDPRGDVWLNTSKRSSVVRNVDLVGTTFKRTATELVVRAQYADLEDRANRQWGFHFVVTSYGPYRREFGWTQSRVNEGEWYSGVTYAVDNGAGNVGPQCPQLRGRANFEADTVTIRVPDRCIGRSTWVRASLVESMARSRPTASTDVTDNPFNTGAKSEKTPRLVKP